MTAPENDRSHDWNAINAFRRKARRQEDSHAGLAQESKKQRDEFGFDIAAYLRTATGSYVRTLPDRIAQKRQLGRIVKAVELCGQASGASIGIHHTYAMLLEKEKNHKTGDDVSITEGDIFKPHDTKIFLERIDSESSAETKSLDYVFFRPWGGLNLYQDSDYSMIRLYELLRELYARLKPDGEMILQMDLENPVDPGTLALTAAKSNPDILKWCFTEWPYLIIKREGGPERLPPLGVLLSHLKEPQREFIRENTRLTGA